MQIEKLNDNHIEEAAKLALYKYELERQSVASLPGGDYNELFCTLISKIISHGLGVCAIEEGNIIGFLTCYSPISNLFGTFAGVFSPIHAHGTIKENSGSIYSRLYQKASDIWVSQGVLSHSISIYSHDDTVISSFFHNGFGLRCVDAIRPLKKLPFAEVSGYSYSECDSNDYSAIAELENKTIKHLRSTPMFMPRNPNKDESSISKAIVNENARFFVVRYEDKPIGYIKIADEGENFATYCPDMKNLCGAYLLAKHRSQGIFTNLLSFVSDILISEGYKRLGVDYESFNPTANAFWNKYFTPYTYSVARRIDERIFPIKNYD